MELANSIIKQSDDCTTMGRALKRASRCLRSPRTPCTNSIEKILSIQPDDRVSNITSLINHYGRSIHFIKWCLIVHFIDCIDAIIQEKSETANNLVGMVHWIDIHLISTWMAYLSIFYSVNSICDAFIWTEIWYLIIVSYDRNTIASFIHLQSSHMVWAGKEKALAYF